MDFDTAVKLGIEVAQALGATVEDVEAAFRRLHGRRLLVPEPGDPSRIRMAPPFSGVETPFLVRARGKSYYANCVWDAYGVAAALHEDVVVEASDGFTGQPILLEVRGGRPVPRDCVVHFAVPAARWWDDVIHT
jgi:hypothetical protein